MMSKKKPRRHDDINTSRVRRAGTQEQPHLFSAKMLKWGGDGVGWGLGLGRYRPRVGCEAMK